MTHAETIIAHLEAEIERLTAAQLEWVATVDRLSQERDDEHLAAEEYKRAYETSHQQVCDLTAERSKRRRQEGDRDAE